MLRCDRQEFSSNRPNACIPLAGIFVFVWHTDQWECTVITEQCCKGDSGSYPTILRKFCYESECGLTVDCGQDEQKAIPISSLDRLAWQRQSRLNICVVWQGSSKVANFSGLPNVFDKGWKTNTLRKYESSPLPPPPLLFFCAPYGLWEIAIKSLQLKISSSTTIQDRYKTINNLYLQFYSHGDT